MIASRKLSLYGLVLAACAILLLTPATPNAAAEQHGSIVVKRSEDRVWLEGVQGWSFAQRASSVHAAQAAILQAVGVDTRYDDLVAVSGLAFRMQVFKDKLCPSSPHAHCGFR